MPNSTTFAGEPLLLIFSTSVSGQVDMGFLKSWKTYSIPENIMWYSSAKNNWIVYLDGNEIRVVDETSYTYKQNLANKKLPFKVEQAGLTDAVWAEDGYLVGFNNGEWGGKLYWFSKNGKKKYEIARSSPIQFIKRSNIFYAITGLSHLGMSDGNIIKIEKEEKKWVAKKYLKLPDAPNAIQLDSKNNMLVFTVSGLYSIDEEANLNTLAVKFRRPTIPIIELPGSVDTLRVIQKPIEVCPKWVWGFLNPSSMVIQNDVVYVGMRGGVYKFDITTKKEEWLLPE